MRCPTRPDLIDGLNDDLARAYARVIQGCTFASVVPGTDRPVLQPYFAGHVEHGVAHAGILADAIVALGGTPATHTAPIRMSDHPQGMLRVLHETECASVDAYFAHRSLAQLLGEPRTALALGTLGRDAIGWRDELKLRLSEWMSDNCSSRPHLVRSDSAARPLAGALERTPRRATVGIDLSDDDQNAGSYA